MLSNFAIDLDDTFSMSAFTHGRPGPPSSGKSGLQL